jgi:hypothetical protein
VNEQTASLHVGFDHLYAMKPRFRQSEDTLETLAANRNTIDVVTRIQAQEISADAGCDCALRVGST